MLTNHKLFFVPKQSKTNQLTHSFKTINAQLSQPINNYAANEKKAKNPRTKQQLNPHNFLLNPSNQKPNRLVTLGINIPNIVKLNNKNIDRLINYLLLIKDEASLIALCNSFPVNVEKHYNHPDDNGSTYPLLVLGIEFNFLEFVDYGLKVIKSNIDKINHKIVHHAISAEMIVLLHKHKIDINTLNKGGNTRLCKFATAGYIDAVKEIVEKCNPSLDHAIYKLFKELVMNHLAYENEKENKLINILKYLIIKKDDMDTVRDFLSQEYSHLAYEYDYLLKDCKNVNGSEGVHFLWILQKNLDTYIHKQKILDKLWVMHKEAENEIRLNPVAGNGPFSKLLKY